MMNSLIKGTEAIMDARVFFAGIGIMLLAIFAAKILFPDE
jgi:hypothetical protein